MPSQNSSEGVQSQTSSFLISAPAKPTQKRTWPPDDEIIPDSEEERIKEQMAPKGSNSNEHEIDTRELSSSPSKRPRVLEPTVIVISSDSDEELAPQRPKGYRQPSSSNDPFMEEVSSGSGEGTARRRPPPPVNSTPPLDKGKGKARTPLPCIESEDDSDVICISDTATDTAAPAPSSSPVKERILGRTLTPYAPILDPINPDLNSDDPAILTFDPHVHAKPISRTPSEKPKTPARSRGLPAPAHITPSATKSPRKRKVSPEQQRLETYARTLFDELNKVVFKDGMPETELVWNVRLLSTAGRAFYTRNRQQQMSLKIELSPKVVDCDERVRHTLAHEMCHLAVWVLDGDPHEQGHGPQFKTWATRVTKARPDIVISTRHTYDINYKFKWECVECGKVYGRHSNSINTEKSACGVCNPPGRLRPLFEKRTRRTPKAASGSKLASGSPRESPRSLDRPPPSPAKSPTKPKSREFGLGVDLDLSDSDDVENLIKGLGAVSINGGR